MAQRSRLRAVALAVVLVGVLVVPLVADAGVVGSDFRISGANATGYEYSPSVAYDSTTNQFLIVWFDYRNSATRGSDIYGRRVAPDGTRVGSDFRISGANATGYEYSPSVAYDSATNQFLVVWSDFRNEATRGTDIYGRRVAPDGTRVGSDFRISGANATSNEGFPSVAYNSTTNQFLVVWHDGRNDATRDSDIYGRRVAWDGTRVGSDFRISGANATDWESHPSVAYNSTTNQFLVVWNDGRTGATRGSDIYGRRVAADGTRVGSDFRISGVNATEGEYAPSVAYNSTTNQFLVVWQDDRNQAARGSDIYGRRVAADGTRVGSDFRICGANATSNEGFPSVAYNSTTNQFLVVWQDDRNQAARGSDIYGRRVAADGTRVGSDFRISGANATNYEYSPSVACNSTTNQFLVVWYDYRNSATHGTDIYGRRVSG